MDDTDTRMIAINRRLEEEGGVNRKLLQQCPTGTADLPSTILEINAATARLFDQTLKKSRHIEYVNAGPAEHTEGFDKVIPITHPSELAHGLDGQILTEKLRSARIGTVLLAHQSEVLPAQTFQELIVTSALKMADGGSVVLIDEVGWNDKTDTIKAAISAIREELGKRVQVDRRIIATIMLPRLNIFHCLKTLTRVQLSLPYLDIASGPKALDFLGSLKEQRPLYRTVYFNDTAFFVQKNFEELHRAYALPAQCDFLKQDALSLPYEFPPKKLGTVRLCETGVWLHKTDRWCERLMDRITPEHGKILITTRIGIEKDIEDFSWVRMDNFDEETFRQIAATEGGYRTAFDNELFLKFRRLATGDTASRWDIRSGSLNKSGDFQEGELLNENGIWTLAHVLAKIGQPFSMQNSAIEWTGTTWNPVEGCKEVSPGCARCYAKTMAERFRGVVGHVFQNGFDPQLVPGMLDKPLHWKKPREIFVNSMSDIFLETIPDVYIEDIARVMLLAKWHTFQILTKRSGRMKQMLRGSMREAAQADHILWGVSVENRKHGLPRVDDLRASGARKKFLSVEPLLEDLTPMNFRGMNWVIAGGESGKKARLMEESWVLRVMRHCRDIRVPFFFKQWGGTQKWKTGRLLRGKEYNEKPEMPHFETPPNADRKTMILAMQERIAYWNTFRTSTRDRPSDRRVALPISLDDKPSSQKRL